MVSKEIIVVAASIADDDSTINVSKYMAKGVTLIDCALVYIRDVLEIDEIEKGSPEFNDVENLGKLVDFEDEGVYYYTEEFIYRFMLMNDLDYIN